MKWVVQSHFGSGAFWASDGCLEHFVTFLWLVFVVWEHTSSACVGGRGALDPQVCLGKWLISSGIHISPRIKSSTAEYCTVPWWSVLISNVSGFNVLADTFSEKNPIQKVESSLNVVVSQISSNTDKNSKHIHWNTALQRLTFLDLWYVFFSSFFKKISVSWIMCALGSDLDHEHAYKYQA